MGNLGERYHNNSDAKNDPFAFSLDSNERMKKLYLDAEHEDGYIRDRNCFADDITIEDNLSMIIKYKNRTVMTYNTYAYAPWEGYRCVFNGSKGRIEINVVESGYNPLGEPINKETNGTDGGDVVMLRDLLLGDQEDKFKRAAGIRDGGNAVLVGVGANKSMESGMPIKVQDLVKW